MQRISKHNALFKAFSVASLLGVYVLASFFNNLHQYFHRTVLQRLTPQGNLIGNDKSDDDDGIPSLLREWYLGSNSPTFLKERVQELNTSFILQKLDQEVPSDNFKVPSAKLIKLPEVESIIDHTITNDPTALLYPSKDLPTLLVQSVKRIWNETKEKELTQIERSSPGLVAAGARFKLNERFFKGEFNSEQYSRHVKLEMENVGQRYLQKGLDLPLETAVRIPQVKALFKEFCSSFDSSYRAGEDLAKTAKKVLVQTKQAELKEAECLEPTLVAAGSHFKLNEAFLKGELTLDQYREKVGRYYCMP